MSFLLQDRLARFVWHPCPNGESRYLKLDWDALAGVARCDLCDEFFWKAF